MNQSFSQATATIAGITSGIEECYKVAEGRLEYFRGEHFDDFPVQSTVCALGPAASAIVKYSENEHSDLIMMPTHGHGAFHRFLLGSITTGVLRHAACPVWTDAHLEVESGADHVSVKRILCAVDLTHDCAGLLKATADLAGRFSAEVRIAHCVDVPESGPPENFLSELDRHLARCTAEELAKKQAEAETDYPVSMAGGVVSKVVRDIAPENETDLVVIGRGHLRNRFGKLRSNSYAIIREAPCPVMSL